MEDFITVMRASLLHADKVWSAASFFYALLVYKPDSWF